MPEYNVAWIKTCTEAEGPFRRTAIWFQGCDIRCEGCCNPELQPFVRKHLMSMEELVSAILDAREKLDTEGVTLLGGEPTLQNIAPLCKELHTQDIGIILFTGHLFDNLDDDLKNSVDLVVDGPFKEDDEDFDRNLIGSRNQSIVDVSGRYSDELDWFNSIRDRKVEISFDGGSLCISGDYVLKD